MFWLNIFCTKKSAMVIALFNSLFFDIISPMALQVVSNQNNKIFIV